MPPERIVLMDLFVSNLRARAVELQITHAEVARRADLDQRRFGHYVTGVREPKLPVLMRIAKALQTTPDALLGLDGKAEALSPRAALEDRLNSAIMALADQDVETIVVQTEALAVHRLKAGPLT